MPRRLFACTPSRLAAFDCPRRYRLTYLDRPTPPRGAPWAHNTLGAVVHVALHRWWNLARRHRSPVNGATLVERHWQNDGFRDAEQAERWRRIAQDWVQRYVETLDPDDEPLGVERTVAVTTERLALSGRVDRLDDRSEGLVVVDYKTGRLAPDLDDARGSLALALYAVASARTLRRSCVRVELHHLPSGTIAAFEHSEDSLRRHVARAETTADDIIAACDTADSGADADSVFPAVTGPGCTWCDFRRNCPEGRAASPTRASWDGLADLDGGS
ncbi:MAG: PD-(D/E)XK nuclease family protein [Actinobacteria bacterium]|nr:PD-(D/E)XK nuclease family protein [Actinomycetota bacterium]